jgi:hypothetical protein
MSPPPEKTIVEIIIIKGIVVLPVADKHFYPP